MKFTETKIYKFAKFKRYFDVGYGGTSVVKYGIGYLGLANTIITNNMKWAMIMGFSYIIFCFLMGWLAFKVKFIEAEKEVTNQYDHFVREMRNLSGAKVLNNT